MKKERRKHIELFAGCGGMALGLGAAGFELIFANELSPMAAETFAFNILGVNLNDADSSESAKLRSAPDARVRWINSQYGVEGIKKRLREDPNHALPRYDELSGELADIQGSLIVGSIVTLRHWLQGHGPEGFKGRGQSQGPRVGKRLRFEKVDLLSGGPPCQSFSSAGFRDRLHPRNRMPHEFAALASLVQPRLVLLENVSGILRPFTDPTTGVKSVAAFEVAKAFAERDFLPMCFHLNAWFFGVAQNRPRFVMVGLNLKRLIPRMRLSRRSMATDTSRILEKVRAIAGEVFHCQGKDNFTQDAILRAGEFWRSVKLGNSKIDKLLMEEHPLKPTNGGKFSEAFDRLDPLNALRARQMASSEKTDGNTTKSVKDAIDDLATSAGVRIKADPIIPLPKWGRSHAERLFELPVSNHEHRNNSKRVQARFRLYKAIQKSRFDLPIRVLLETALRDSDANKRAISRAQIPKDVWETLGNYDLFDANGNKVSSEGVSQLLEDLHTRKHTQGALDPNQPAPVTMSIPDDACHYAPDQDRTLTVREMARIQSFPDWFEFRGKITTGGSSRRYEVPQYTQVGNAVPPLMARGLGLVAEALLMRLDLHRPSGG